MDIVRFAISRPVTVAVGVILVVMFGLIGFGAIPIQLTPNVDRPTISVQTNWSGRSPQEIVDEIIKEQEEQLKSVAGLDKMTSNASEGSASISLEFNIGVDMRRALQEVSDALRQVPEYPEDVDEPRIDASGGDVSNAITWIIIDIHPDKRELHRDFDISTLFDAVDRQVKPMIERVPGVSEVNVYGGREREVRVLVDSTQLAHRGLSHADVLSALRSENRNVSGGTIAEGKRDVRVRMTEQFGSAEDVLDTIVAYDEGGPVYLRDVGEVEMGHQKKRGFVRSVGDYAIAINATRETGTNVMQVMGGIRQALADVEAHILPKLDPVAGPDLRLRQVYDETDYVESAIALVLQNLWVGGLLAAFVLMLFLRSFVSTGIIALAIPVSVIGTFLAMIALGRTLNVISLAGLAFAVGMVVDNAIVVLENIYRHVHMGKPPMRAAYEGGKEVWGAILASTLTTVAVFVPVLTVQDEAGQLFRDISLAIVASVTLSLIVSITVIPAAASRWMGDPSKQNPGPIRRAFQSLFGLAPLVGGIARLASDTLHWLMTGWRAHTLRPLVIVAMTGASLWGAAMLAPPLDYLPAGNRNLVFGGLLIPPGYSVGQMETIAERVESQLNPYTYYDGDAELATRPPIVSAREMDPRDPTKRLTFEPMGVDNYFIGSFGGTMFVGATSTEDLKVKPIGTLVSNAMGGIPDSYGGASQASIFGRGLDGGDTINIELSGDDLNRIKAVANAMFGMLMQATDDDAETIDYGPMAVRAEPANFNLTQPEYRVELTRAAREMGVRADAMGTTIRALFDGAFAGDFQTGADTIDIRVLPKGGRLDYKEQLSGLSVATPAGPVVPLDTLVDIVPGTAPQQIVRIEELPSVSLRVTPPQGAALEEVMTDLRENYIAPLVASGMIDSSVRWRLEGTAAKLDEAKAALMGEPRSPGAPTAAWQGIVRWGALGMLVVGLLVGLALLVRMAAREQVATGVYAALGATLIAVCIGAVLFIVATQPQLATARMVWALVVTYLLMAALFESFVHPFVILFTVPLAIVGGFAGLRIVHDWTLTNPMINAQNLDVLTMLGFVILVGVVVNNAILIVHQALNLLHGDADSKHAAEVGDDPMRAIAEAVRTRVRPVFMSTLTSVGGMLPLVLFPGSGSELYRGLGSVVVGGLLVSTVFTLVLVPLVFSVTMDMQLALRRAIDGTSSEGAPPPAAPARKPASEPDAGKARRPAPPELTPA